MPSFLGYLSPVQLSMLAGMISFFITVFPPLSPFISFILSFFSAVPLYFVGFLHGRRSAILAAGFVFFLVAMFFNITAALFYCVSTIFPLIIVVSTLAKDGLQLNFQEQQSLSFGYVLSCLSMVGLGVFLMGNMLFFVAQGQDPVIFLTQRVTLLYSSALQSVSPALILLIPSIFFISTLFSTFLNIIITIKCLKLTNISCPSFFKKDVYIHPYWDISLCFGLLLQFWPSSFAQFMGSNIALISSIPIFIFGLSIVFDIFSISGIKKGVFNLFLFVCFFLLVWMGPFVVLIGVLEPLLKIRKRLS